MNLLHFPLYKREHFFRRDRGNFVTLFTSFNPTGTCINDHEKLDINDRERLVPNEFLKTARKTCRKESFTRSISPRRGKLCEENSDVENWGEDAPCKCGFIFRSARSFKENVATRQDSSNQYTTMVFCGWDYNMTDAKSARLKRAGIYQEITVRLWRISPN